ncbi:small protein A (tmRNA-binding) [Thiorhodovibrio frisius]|uniref:Outer membrane protein assembly factor BamE n=2 Tax=Thiorhodovibrio frisius TaxID=631362 RepID=H8Z5Z2_9GAMM|nr:small protein A (tmRNA-binding) [Thiorhodovibrio frisius]
MSGVSFRLCTGGTRSKVSMRRLLIIITATALAGLLAIGLSGCAGKRSKPAHEKGAKLSNLPFVYKMTVQQGNLITEEMVARVELGMTRAQVRYLLGTPLLTDIFHTDRWDYPYTIRRGHRKMEERKLTLWFDGDSLVRILGDYEANPDGLPAAEEEREFVVEVPDWKNNRGLINKALNAVGAKK